MVYESSWIEDEWTELKNNGEHSLFLHLGTYNSATLVLLNFVSSYMHDVTWSLFDDLKLESNMDDMDEIFLCAYKPSNSSLDDYTLIHTYKILQQTIGSVVCSQKVPNFFSTSSVPLGLQLHLII